MRVGLEIAALLAGVLAFLYVCAQCGPHEDPFWSTQRGKFAHDATERELEAWTRDQIHWWDVLYWVRRWRRS